MVNLQEGLCQAGSSQIAAASPPPLWWVLPTRTSTGDTPILACSYGSVSCIITAPFLWVLVCTWFCLCSFRLKSLFPPALCKSYNQILLAFKVRSRGDSCCLCQVPRLRSLMWGSKPSQQCENFFGIIVLQVVGHPPSMYRIWFYCDCAPLAVLL